MKTIVIVLLIIGVSGCGLSQIIDPFNPSKRLVKAEEDLRNAKDDYWRLRPLGEAGMACVDLGRLDEAQKYGEELLQLADRLYPEKGDADSIHHGNIVLGRVALRRGDVESAKLHLLKSGQVETSPVLGSFGPNMMLAKELLERNEREVVLEYFKLCGAFWEYDKKDNLLKIWTEDVEGGKMPDFGANLHY